MTFPHEDNPDLPHEIAPPITMEALEAETVIEQTSAPAWHQTTDIAPSPGNNAMVAQHNTPPPTMMAANPLDLPTEVFAASLDRRGTNRKSLIQWVGQALVEGTDYGKIHIAGKNKCQNPYSCKNPRHFSKPSLWKAGAEKIAGMLGVTVRFPTLPKYEEACLEGRTLTNILLRCEIVDGSGSIVSTGAGARALKQDFGDLNKCLKMCMKSSFVDAVLRLGGLSEVFTQDLEDMIKQDQDQPPAQKPPQQQQQRQPQQPTQTRDDSGELLNSMKAAVAKIKAIPHLENWWRKHASEIRSLPPAGQAAIKEACAEKKRILTNTPPITETTAAPAPDSAPPTPIEEEPQPTKEETEKSAKLADRLTDLAVETTTLNQLNDFCIEHGKEAKSLTTEHRIALRIVCRGHKQRLIDAGDTIKPTTLSKEDSAEKLNEISQAILAAESAQAAKAIVEQNTLTLQAMLEAHQAGIAAVLKSKLESLANPTIKP